MIRVLYSAANQLQWQLLAVGTTNASTWRPIGAQKTYPVACERLAFGLQALRKLHVAVYCREQQSVQPYPLPASLVFVTPQADVIARCSVFLSASLRL
jgi:hypothetical protein